ncbi:cysteine desulfuration protein SufE [Vibrio tritonius]|uniref:Cysteine desulfuration protein SufE n=1 Tax=Vibrio tritonius TaxID=1435069 RepID=A0ABS7YQ34_9VIBR|nr:cysteine desulfuration protein SufE [Vibrio tritonius]MCA2016359.1 cysteine desulfuration protein SufE [Vibrio tritonius]
MTPERLVKNFARCNDWEERYLYLIELGQRLPPYPSDKMSERHLVEGCQSKVWLAIEENDYQIVFDATSDTLIVKGLIALIRIAFNEKTPLQIIDFDIDNWFEQLGLTSHLTPSRQQGLYAMVNKIQRFASRALHITS